MIAIAVLAVLLGSGVGLRRRSQRHFKLAQRYGGEAERLEYLWAKMGPVPQAEADAFWNLVHWNDSVAYAYFQASSRPWLPFDPEPRQIVCECGHHLTQRARTAK